METSATQQNSKGLPTGNAGVASTSDFRPRVGDAVTYLGKPVGTVTRVEGNLCFHSGSHDGPFIWRFHDGLNALHSWPGKDETLNAKCPGV